MIIGPRYKIGRRLGAAVFDKCQTQRFALSEARHEKSTKRRKGPTSNFGRQLLEKQKIRLAYGVNERQLRRYIKEASSRHSGKDPTVSLFEQLECRLDNLVYRAGIAASRRQARQLVSHGHFTVNERKVTIPSYHIVKSDLISVRKSSESKTFFENAKERIQNVTPPAWMVFDQETMTIRLTDLPSKEVTESIADLSSVIEFYSR